MMLILLVIIALLGIELLLEPVITFLLSPLP
jgi:hypothetical protein